ncbi:PadR family transcriptional regulator [Halorientalis regularis]|uniref:Transcriptional regulator PadR-like family protein n=1 Tax=Halorientalis regularis TaxID=660518 RepID=A0A1G7QEA0_9EURY|nr:PadR family transcriptional regulator [Halorientalis regularis]SDF95920.1 Transcriptional regulator PadR-like family protein [Halorientalis regularis]
MSQTTTESTDDVSATDLTAFQKEALFAIARLEASENDSYGLGIKRQLAERLGEDVNHGRLYPNLDDLVEQGILQKAQMDKRTNRYTLTDDGKELLRDYRDYVTETVASL